MSSISPRPYQRETIDALFDGWADEGVRSLAVQLPTGTGKTVIFAHLAKEWIEDRTGRVLILVHRDELVRQAVQKLHSVDPGLKVGVVKAERNEVDANVIVASVQTLGRRARLDQFGSWTPGYRSFGLIIVDEAHHTAAESYRKILDHFPDAKVAGFSATLSRMDGKGLGDVFEDVVIKRDILWGIINGWLVDVRGKRVDVEALDLGGVKRSGGDYQAEALGTALVKASAPDIVAAQYLEHARKDDGTLRRGLVFWPSVAAAKAGSYAMWAAGIRSANINGATPIEDRQQIYKAIRAGELDVIHNCMVLTEGFDLPEIECIVIARPTTSPGLYVQMTGRGLRPSHGSGKRDCLLLDVVGVSGSLKLASPADLSETRLAVRDGESLVEAVERTRAVVADLVAGRRGTITVHDVDLFETSSERWLRTARGFWFLPAGRWIVSVVPSDASEDLYDVWAVYTHFEDRQPNYRVAERTVLDYAKAWAEQTATELDQENQKATRRAKGITAAYSTTSRAASWRKRKEPPTENMLRLAGRMRIIVPTGASKGDVSDLIDVANATRILDTYVIPPVKEDT